MSKQNQFEYRYDQALQGYVVSSVIGTLKDPHMVIPDSYNGEPVVAIGSSFCDCSNAEGAQKLISLTLPASVKRIGTAAFYNCETLETVILPEDISLGVIEARAFGYCKNLKDITLPASLRAIGNAAFFHCYSLEQVCLGTCLISLGDLAFSQCTALTDLRFAPDCELPNVTSRAFSHCKNLRSVEIPRDIETIEEKAFEFCDKLERVSFAEGSELEEIRSEAFFCCSSLEELSFANCAKLRSIQRSAFDGTKLTGDVQYHPDSKVILGQNAFPEKESDKKRGGCYVATCVYGSYDCAPVWTLRRFRDENLAKTVLGRCFIRCYYSISPTVVRLFGDTKWFVGATKPLLDRLVDLLHRAGYADTPYED